MDMVLQLVADMNNALDANCYFAALSVTLMLPDICGKAEYPEEQSTKRRYIQWFDEWIGKYEINPDEDPENPTMPHLSGEVIYQLRNSFLHQGTPNIDKEKIKAPENKIDEFILVLETKKEFDIYCDSASVGGNGNRTYSVNIQRLCMIIGSTAEGYYKLNKDKFSFLNYKLVDWDKETKRFNNNEGE